MNHCAEPKCVKNCPTGAMHKREDGVVFIDYDTFIGCGTCKEECPYDVPVIDVKLSKSSKCSLCYDRIDRGQAPFCIQSCPVQARIFVDLNDKKSEAAKLISSGKAYQIKPEAKTNQSIYYLGK